MKKKSLFFVVISSLLIISCSKNFMGIPRAKEIQKNISYISNNEHVKYSDTLTITVQEIRKNKYSIIYKLVSYHKNKGLTRYDVDGLDLRKDKLGEGLIIHIIPFYKGKGKVGSDVMNMTKRSVFIGDKKEKLSPEIKKIKFVYGYDSKIIELPKNKKSIEILITK